MLWIVRTGAPWRDLPEEFGKWEAVYRQFLRWTRSGLWDLLLDALKESGVVPSARQMIDSTIVRAHHHAAGAKGGFKDMLLAARAVASRPKSMPGRTTQASLSASTSHRAKRTTRRPTRR